jgi:hypothetical protein
MAKIYNSDLIKELRDVGKIQISTDKIPNEIADKVVPVINVNPKQSRVINAILSSAVTASGVAQTLLAAQPNRDFFITSASISIVKDAACTPGREFYHIICTIDGATKNILTIPYYSAVASESHKTISFPIPIKIDRNTAITTSIFDYGAGTSKVSTNVSGYFVDNKNA